jgi:GSH-dependent disulfide-bond oxidoreductase
VDIPEPPEAVELFMWPTPNASKVLIYLEETGLPYTVKLVDITRGEQFLPDFLAIAPNNRMPAIVDPGGPSGEPISLFESGAILQYLGRKTGRFYPDDERGRAEVDQWLFWQMAELGPTACQARYFRVEAEPQDYAIRRYTDECQRLFRVLERRLDCRMFIAGDYSIADMACWPWIREHETQGQDLQEFPNVRRWFADLAVRPAVVRTLTIGRQTERSDVGPITVRGKSVLFGQRAR